ncbi:MULTISPECIES: hypothetical protein [unclassified Facklamia]|uniref:hypothetical protein n=1 Tax=Aerococcaceae TaxID=186827 RepID=UPI0013B937E3|nr:MULTISPECIES: hypothetical protein [unclassified Facklamia]MBS4462900.1 hypothetical protein [Aerococcaceae bacterium zg-B36]NEW65298.1 hypothetical protein [Facklamia sp. 252]NEW68802.1 hypothetical protein [Facklamia sp. 253]QQD66113.1 hypothetical protein JDW14_03120 [Aerococcaceae bacterium zg-252]
MGILDTLNKVKADGFDPKKDKVNNGGRLESGEYPIHIATVERTADKRQNEVVDIKFEVISGDFKGRFEFLRLNFNPELPDFVLETNGKLLLKIIEFTGLSPKKSDLVDEEAITELLQKAIGKQFKMTLKITPNKNNPEYPYRNYEFSSLDENPDLPEIEDDDLPF